jgi:hypothetical protein
MTVIIKPTDLLPVPSKGSTQAQRFGRAFWNELHKLAWNEVLTIYFEGQRYSVSKEILRNTDADIGWLATPAK